MDQPEVIEVAEHAADVTIRARQSGLIRPPMHVDAARLETRSRYEVAIGAGRRRRGAPSLIFLDDAQTVLDRVIPAVTFGDSIASNG
jgi:hypothetical protein